MSRKKLSIREKISSDSMASYILASLLGAIILVIIIYQLYQTYSSAKSSTGLSLSPADTTIKSIINGYRTVVHDEFQQVSLSVTLLLSIVGLVAIWLLVKVERHGRKLDLHEATIESPIIQSVYDIYKEVDTQILNKKKSQRLSIEIIAYTLHHITPYFEKWEEQDKLHNINLKLYYMEEAFIKSDIRIDNDWVSDLNINLRRIKMYLNNTSVKKRFEINNVKIEFNKYSFFPGVHGVRIHDTIYFSLAVWDRHTGLLKTSEDAHYLKLMPHDNRPLTKRFRFLFENWISNANNFGSAPTYGETGESSELNTP